jgi:hypothetical protein
MAGEGWGPLSCRAGSGKIGSSPARRGDVREQLQLFSRPDLPHTQHTHTLRARVSGQVRRGRVPGATAVPGADAAAALPRAQGAGGQDRAAGGSVCVRARSCVCGCVFRGEGDSLGQFLARVFGYDNVAPAPVPWPSPSHSSGYPNAQRLCWRVARRNLPPAHPRALPPARPPYPCAAAHLDSPAPPPVCHPSARTPQEPP